MKNALIVLLCVAAAATAVGAQDLNVTRTGGQVEPFGLAGIDSITFGLPGGDKSLLTSGEILRVHAAGATQLFPVAALDSLDFAGDALVVHRGAVAQPFLLAEIDSLTFASFADYAVTVTYGGATATVVNPLAGLGVAVAVSGADVTVTSSAGVPGVEYRLSGTTTDGMFKIYADDDFVLRLAGVQITNLNGPAVNVQADETIDVVLEPGTVNALTDGVTYAAAPAGEDQKAAFFSEGQLVFSGAGSLTVTGRGTSQHGLGSDDFIDVRGGAIVVAAAVKDGVHTNEGFYQSGGSINVTAHGDGIDGGAGPIGITGGAVTVLGTDADRDALKCDGLIDIAGGDVDLTVQGNQSKGLNSPAVTLSGGTLDITTSGGVVLEASGLGFDPSYCTGIKADDLVLVDGCQLTITATGVAGRGISCDGDISIQSGGVTVHASGGGGTYTDATGVVDAYHGPCLNADGDLLLMGGTISLTHTGSAGKGIAGDSDLTIGAAGAGPALQIAVSGASISIGGGEYAEAKAASVDSVLTVDGGTLTLTSVDDALKAKVRLEINGGTINVVNALEGFEAPNLYITGGEVHINTTDDGINATYGVDGEASDGSILNISGGYVHLRAPAGDGIDSNGSLTISGGTVVVHGPPNQPEVGLDVNGAFLMQGGLTVVSQINSMMNEVPAGSSTQRTVLVRTSTAINAGTLFHIENASGATLVTFRPDSRYSAVLFSSSALAAGVTYRVYTGGTCTGTLRDGLYTGGTYSGGTLRTTFTSTSVSQTVTF